MPNPVVIVAVLAVCAWVILNKTPLGEYFMAVDGNPKAARIVGVPVTITKLAAYMISGLMAAVAPLIGCVILGTLRNGLTILNVQAFYQLLATGIIIIVAMMIDKATSGK